MKKRLAWILTLGWLLLLLAGCGAASGGGTAGVTEENVAMDAPRQMTDGDYGSAEQEQISQPSDRTKGTKRIYTANFNLETTSFDDAAAGLSKLVESSGGWLQGSSVEYGGSGYRYGNYVIRIPHEKFDAFLNQVGQLCHVTYRSTNVEDVTESYYDTAGRLATQKTKLERLQKLLGQAKNMEDIITIESAISDTELQIEALSGDLRHFDAQIDYATVNLTLKEVYQLSNVEQPSTGFGSRIVQALTSGSHAFVAMLQTLVVTLAYGWVPITLAAIVLIVGITVFRKRGGFGRINHQTRTEKKDDKPK